MPVNTASLKTFAPAMRRQLLEAVGRKLDLLLHSQTPDTLSTYAKQIAELREQEADNRGQLLERVAYTWFNRLCALRYLDARAWHPFGCKVLMPAGEGETQPELLKLMRAGSLPAEVKTHTNEARLHGLLDGQIPPAMAGMDPQGEVYRELVLASCRSYHQLLPELFEGLDDASELLLPDDLLSEGSIAGGFRIAISDADCEDVEIIGWLYQFYISEKKDQVIGKVVKSEDIPAATQLFTPNWIVKYMVQNSLGATWLATYPDSPLKGTMDFYIEPAEQTPEVQAQLASITPERLDPEALTLIDPACGSGHILVEAYDLLKAIYLEQGYRQRDIPELILTKNLYGLDICPRAAQLAAFSLLMKGREDDRRLFDRGVCLNITALKDSADISIEGVVANCDIASAGLSRADLRMLTELFANATTFGSLIQVPALLAEKLPALSRLAEKPSEDFIASRDLGLLRALTRQAVFLAGRYDVVAANPPYMGSKFMNPNTKEFLSSHFGEHSKDLFSSFVARTLSFTGSTGRNAYVTPFTWMFLLSFEPLRRQILHNYSVSSLVKPSYTSFFDSAIVSLVSYVVDKRSSCIPGVFYDLGYLGSAASQPIKFLQGIRDSACEYRYTCSSIDFSKIPGSPISFWASNSVREVFSCGVPLKAIAQPRQGIATGDNGLFLRFWHEVDLSRIGFGISSRDKAMESGRAWFPYNKGGGFRRWYGNHETVVNWENDGRAIREFGTEHGGRPRSRAQNLDKCFVRSISWAKIASGSLAMRYYPTGFLFDVAGCSIFTEEENSALLILGLCNSIVAQKLVSATSPTVNYEVGQIAEIPLVNEAFEIDVATLPSKDLIEIYKSDWDAFERSWDFQVSPLLTASRDKETENTLQQSYSAWVNKSKSIICNAKRLEERNNEILVQAYGLQGEVETDVHPDQVSLTINPLHRYGGDSGDEEKWSRFRIDAVSEFLSYFVGCTMGRYSLDHPGLILADSRNSQADQLATYKEKVNKPLSEVQFKPDPDGIIPVLDGEWFEDDIVTRTREFLEVTFPESTVTENLRFIEESLGNDIRKYFCSEFYKDHLQTYKKRPIYWMVQSPKKGFACLIYLHRYTKDTLNQVLNNYFRPYLQKLEARLAQLGLDQLNDSLPTRERTAARKEAEKITKLLKECQAWEQDALLPLAQQRIELDLDDGVKVNYLKLQDVLAPIPGLAAKED